MGGVFTDAVLIYSTSRSQKANFARAFTGGVAGWLVGIHPSLTTLTAAMGQIGSRPRWEAIIQPGIDSADKDIRPTLSNWIDQRIQGQGDEREPFLAEGLRNVMAHGGRV